ncbi:Glu/Leu/Phe/Val family dehydrogenase [Lysinibacillus sp. LZ02]|uniref:Glu/Leu/Phe/Val family dehydrogenase n=1 Tax=Lysinibacillus sp. LZ02 TaxID=3420668 RepID=UPI003D36EACB
MTYLTTEWTDQETGAKGYLVIDKMKNDLCAGGIRMRPGVTKDEVKRLAEIMTIKVAGLGMDVGGAKGGIDFDSRDPRAKEVLARYLQAHLPYIEKSWLTSEDLGTRESEIVEILKSYGLNTSVDAFFRNSAVKEEILRNLQRAFTTKYEDMALTDLVTGYGVMVAVKKVIDHYEIKDPKVAVQGFGSVGASAAKFLAQQNIKVTHVADINGIIHCEDGLDIPYLLSIKDERGNINRTKLPTSYFESDPQSFVNANVDILIPAAIADVINDKNVDEIKAKFIVEGANLPVTNDAEEKLRERDVKVVPDFIANSGGAGLFVAVLTEKSDGTPTSIFEFLENTLSNTVEKIIKIADSNKSSIREAAKYLIIN